MTISLAAIPITPKVKIKIKNGGVDLSGEDLMVGDSIRKPLVIEFTLSDSGVGPGQLKFKTALVKADSVRFKFDIFETMGLEQRIRRVDEWHIEDSIYGVPKRAYALPAFSPKVLVKGLFVGGDGTDKAWYKDVATDINPEFEEEVPEVNIKKADLTKGNVFNEVLDSVKINTYFRNTGSGSTKTTRIDAIHPSSFGTLPLNTEASANRLTLKKGFKNPSSAEAPDTVPFGYLFMHDVLTEGQWVANPVDSGDYNVAILLGQGENIEETGTDEPVRLLEKLKVTWAKLRTATNFKKPAKAAWNVPYNKESVYAIPAFTLASEADGELDSVVYVVDSVWGTGSSSGAKTKGVNVIVDSENGGAFLNFPDSVNKKGITAKLSAIGYGKTGSAGSLYYPGDGRGFAFMTDAIPCSLVIKEKSLKASTVRVVIEQGEDNATYNGLSNPLKMTAVQVFDGEEELDSTTVNGSFSVIATTKNNIKNAGPAVLQLKGKGNYVDSIEVPYTIYKKPVTGTVTFNGFRIYDGTAKVDTSKTLGITFAFDANQIVSGDSTVSKIRNITSYVISEQAFDSPDAGDAKVITGKVTIKATDPVLKNYRFAETVDPLVFDFRLEDAQISKYVPRTYNASSLKQGDTTLFSFNVPGESLVDGVKTAKHYYNGQSQGIGAVTFKEPFTNPGASDIEVVYEYTSGTFYFDENGDSTKATKSEYLSNPPRRAGSYKVYAVVAEGGTNVTASTGNGTQLGTYTINAPAEPVIGTFANTEVKMGFTKALTVPATSPNGGNLSYQWYRFPATGTVSWTEANALVGATAETYTVVGDESKTTWRYGVEVTNSFPGNSVQIPASKQAGPITVTVADPPQDITGKVIVEFNDAAKAEAGWTYTGDPIVFTKSAASATVTTAPLGVKVYLKDADGNKGAVLDPKYYTLEHSGNTNVGTGTLRVVGDISVVGNTSYTGSVSTTFSIVKKTLVRTDLTMSASREYNYGDTLNAGVTLVKGTGAGTISVLYDGVESVPVKAGRYAVTVDVTEGTNFTAATGIDMGIYNVTKKTPTVASLNYNIPSGHKQGVPGTVYGIGEVTLKGNGADSVAVQYNGLADVPNTAGSYAVTAVVYGVENYTSATVALGTYVITGTAVASANRDVPNSGKVEVAAIAPVKVVASGFTAGPSPVRNGEVIKFFSKSNVKSGSLYIFDQSGNSVAKVKASGSGEIGKWKVSTASEGSYVVKGILLGKDGTKEKVSFVFAVVK
jgi:hypothetical protein